MKLPRKGLKLILGLFSRWATKKHDIELIVVTGFYGTEIVREGIYAMLQDKFKVRRNTTQIHWDMSLPLAILGYKDVHRSVFEWIELLFRAFTYLAFGAKNKHIIVLNANCAFKETAGFWASFLKPSYLVVLNYDQESEIVDKLLSKVDDNTVLIYDGQKVDESKFLGLKVKSKFVYGNSAHFDLSYSVEDKQIKYKKQKVKIPPYVPNFSYPFLAAIFSQAVNHGLTLEEAWESADKFDMESILVKRIKSNIENTRTI